jgi:hypothetical protein
MKKKTMLAIMAAVSLIPATIQAQAQNTTQNTGQNNTAAVAAGNNTIPGINYLLLQNFVETHCQQVRALKPVFELDERYVNQKAWGTGALSCKGEICWSWSDRKTYFDWNFYSSNLPLQITNVERLSKSITQTVKNTQSLKKDASSVVNSAQEFLQATAGAGKGRDTIKERSISESKVQESSVQTNVTILFHRFLGMALQNALPAEYDFCLSSAVDLFYKAFNTNRVNDLVEAFIFFQTTQPADIRFTDGKDYLNRAKFLYLITRGDANSKEKQQFAWASALLFAKLLEWEEFQDVRKLVDDYLDKVYKEYQLLKRHTTKELFKIDKELALLKFAVDRDLQMHNQTQEVEDWYGHIAMFKYVSPQARQNAEQQVFPELQKQLDEALQKNDPILEAKLVEEKKELNVAKFVKEKPQVVAAGVGAGAIGMGVVSALYLRKRRKQNKNQEKQSST